MPELLGVQPRREVRDEVRRDERTPSIATSTSSTPRNDDRDEQAQQQRRAEQQVLRALAARGALDDLARDRPTRRRPSSYTCRYLRTKRIATRLSAKRHDEERRADGEDRRVGDAAGGDVGARGVGDERRHVLVRDRAGRTSRFGLLPLATRITTVSPIARDAPSTSAATMPDSAAGKTTRTTTCHFAAPSPKAPSRSDCGTADIASSLTDAIVGSTRMPRMMPPDRPLKTCTSMPTSFSSRREERQREVAEDDRRDAGEQLDDRLEDLAHARARRTRRGRRRRRARAGPRRSAR